MPPSLCRIIRGGWMIVMMLLTQEADIISSFTARRLAAGVSAELVALHLLMLFTLVFLGGCEVFIVNILLVLFLTYVI
jgi:preprotein translocase subunit SecD